LLERILTQLTISQEHVGPADASDRLAYIAVKAARWSFDTFSGYRFGKINKDKVINRAIFLETVAGCPGMVRTLANVPIFVLFSLST